MVCYLEKNDSNQARVGIVVSRSVGNAVTRNLVKRRVRSIAREHLDSIGGDLVIRALPAAATVTAAQLETDFVSALSRAGQVI